MGPSTPFNGGRSWLSHTLPLSRLTPPCGGLANLRETDTAMSVLMVLSGPPPPLTQLGSFLTESTISTGGHGASLGAMEQPSPQGDYGPLVADDRAGGPPFDQYVGHPGVHHIVVGTGSPSMARRLNGVQTLT